jgi:hypothetical protein
VAQAVVALMHETFARLAPDRICDAFRDTHGDSEGMWAAVGEATVECIAAGCRTLAMLWGSAWAEAGALAPAATEVSRDDLVSLYSDPSFAPSMYLTELVAPAPAPAAAPAAVAAGTPSG